MQVSNPQLLTVAQHNMVLPHTALGYRPSVPEAVPPTPLGELIMSPALS